MYRTSIIYILALLTGIPYAMAASAEAPLTDRSLDQLEQRLEEIDTELKTLAHYSLRSGIGSIGYHSKPRETPEQTEWIQIELEQETPLDEIVFVPTIRRDSQEKFMAEGFPEILRILVGKDNDRTGTLLGEIHCDKETLGIAPLIVPANQTKASWVRIEAERLSLDARKKQYVFQLAEIMIFSKEENVALRQPVNTSSIHPDGTAAWDKRFLVDGHTPYLMDAAQGVESIGDFSERAIQPSLTIDLEEAFPLSRIHLHPLHLANTVPQANSGDLGNPPQLQVEGASLPDFSDAISLLDFKRSSILDTGPVMMWNIPETTCRYVRLTAKQPARRPSVIGFAEIELFSKGRNVARGKPIHSVPPPKTGGALVSPTDGHNRYGNILPIRTWMNQLARRQSLERERPRVASELARRYAKQKANLRLMYGLAALLAAGTAFAILIERFVHMRQLVRIKERFAADLHDELGANLHTIGLLIDLARENIDSREELIELLERSRVFTERSGAAARYCTNMLEASGLCEDLAEEMKRSSDRLLADLEHDLTISGEKLLKNLKPRKRIDLFFFYKECLTNIIRHSGATEVITTLTTNGKELYLTIADNGHGLTDGVPSSLKRRARLLGGKVWAESPAGDGTRIILKFKTRKFGLHR
ncbi:Sensor histidine kinase LiaS [Pontiella desulfatans]|uniref:histidine kinase n=1 Tax=Pontiella desulfatans TaxID=2750659 RepID=A0A6C2TZQ4_PONDE|nr:ATP-binding protein [Pontiella desulfatans]VGO13152.1 Sensor histidine kinase LiaS [Pontiella desulfatans]